MQVSQSKNLQSLLDRKIKKINEMPIQDLYKLPEVKQNDFRVYKEALGLITQDEIKREQQQIIKQYQESTDPADSIIDNILSARGEPDRKQEEPQQHYERRPLPNMHQGYQNQYQPEQNYQA